MIRWHAVTWLQTRSRVSIESRFAWIENFIPDLSSHSSASDELRPVRSLSGVVMVSQGASSPWCWCFVKWIVALTRTFVWTCRQEFDVHAENAWRLLSSQIRCGRRSNHIIPFREADLCLFEPKVVPENASDVVRAFHAQTIGRMLPWLGRRVECDGPMIRVPHTKIGDPVRNARYLRGRHGGGISVEIHISHLDRTARAGEGGSQHCEGRDQLPDGLPADWPAPSFMAPWTQAANFSIHSVPPELMTR